MLWATANAIAECSWVFAVMSVWEEALEEAVPQCTCPSLHLSDWMTFMSAFLVFVFSDMHSRAFESSNLSNSRFSVGLLPIPRRGKLLLTTFQNHTSTPAVFRADSLSL